MPKLTIRPTKQDPNYKRLAVTGTTSAVTAVNDQSDTTYIRRANNPYAPMARFILAAPSIPAANDIATIVPGARLAQPTSAPPRLVTLAMSVWGSGAPVNKIRPTVNGPSVRAGSGTSAYTYATPAGQGNETGPSGPWAGVLSTLAVRVNDGHTASDANRAYIYELYADVYYAARPTVSLATDPATPITTTSYPLVKATFSALVESWQDNSGPPARSEVAYEIKIFSAAQYGASGFDPGISPCVWSTQGLSAPLDYIDGTTQSTEEVDVTPDVPLANGAYRIYARGRRAFAAAQFSTWNYTAITVGITPCPAPALNASVNTATQSVTVTVTPISATGATNPLVSVERSEDGGATWTAVRDATRLPAVFGTPLTVTDTEGARGMGLAYRACVEATFSGQQLVGAWALCPSLSAWSDLVVPVVGTMTGFSGAANSGWGGIGTAADPHCLNHDGSSDYTDFGKPSLLNFAGSFSVDTWARRDVKDAVNSDWIVGDLYWTSDANSRSGWALGWFTNTDLPRATVELTADGTTVVEYYIVATGTIPALGTWHNYAVTFDDAAHTLTIYIDGVARGSVSTVASGKHVMMANAANFRVGYNPTNFGYFPGGIAAVRLYNAHVLTTAELAAIVAAGPNGGGNPTAGLVFRLEAQGAYVASSGWTLRCPLDPSLDALDVAVLADPDWQQDEQATTFRPLGRSRPVVVSMSLGGADGSLTIACDSEAEWAAVQALRDYQGTLLLQSPYGWQSYIRILQRSWTETGTPAGAHREVTVSFVEVAAP